MLFKSRIFAGHAGLLGFIDAQHSTVIISYWRNERQALPSLPFVVYFANEAPAPSIAHHWRNVAHGVELGTDVARSLLLKKQNSGDESRLATAVYSERIEVA